jgi:hypothetical protein
MSTKRPCEAFQDSSSEEGSPRPFKSSLRKNKHKRIVDISDEDTDGGQEDKAAAPAPVAAVVAGTIFSEPSAPAPRKGISCTINRLDGESFDIRVGPTGSVAAIKGELSKLLPDLDVRDMLLHVDGQEEPVADVIKIADLFDSGEASPAPLDLFLFEGARPPMQPVNKTELLCSSP